MQFPTEYDALLVLYLLVHGPSSAYMLAKDFLDAGLLKAPERSGIHGVVRVVDSRLKRLVRDGYLSKADGKYFITDRVFVDDLYIVGDILKEDLGSTLVFDVNGHYVLFDLEGLLEDLPKKAVEQLFVKFSNKKEESDIIAR